MAILNPWTWKRALRDRRNYRAHIKAYHENVIGIRTFEPANCWHVWTLSPNGSKMYLRRKCYPTYFAAVRGARDLPAAHYIMQCLYECRCKYGLFRDGHKRVSGRKVWRE